MERAADQRDDCFRQLRGDDRLAKDEVGPDAKRGLGSRLGGAAPGAGQGKNANVGLTFADLLDAPGGSVPGRERARQEEVSDDQVDGAVAKGLGRNLGPFCL